MTAKRRSRSRLWGRVGLVGLLLLGGAFVLGWIWVHDRPRDDPGPIEVVIPPGAGLDDIVDILEARGLTDQPFALSWVLRLSDVGSRIQAGVHSIPGNANALELVDHLGRSAQVAPHHRITLLPGWSVWEAARTLDAVSPGEGAALLALAADHAYVHDTLKLPVGPPRAARADGVAPTYLEGFLYPDTYFVPPGVSARQLVARATARFQEVWGAIKAQHASELDAVQRTHAISERELIVLASLVEEETGLPDEAPRIAGVFYNRLAQRMRLQTDPTLMYRPDRVAKEPRPVHRKDRTNPFNTYAIARLPPGAICGPGRRALEAVVSPETHAFIYFVAKRDGMGGHAFAATLAEHEANIDKYLRTGR